MSHEPMDPLDQAPLCFLVGPTASGKTALALDLAEQAGAEILSLDSMLVYRGLDIGTAKPGVEERERVPHHLIDRVGPEESYDAKRYLDDVRAALDAVRSRGRRALFVGGTGFYLAAVLRGLFEGPAVDPALREALRRRMREEGREALFAELTRHDPAAAERLHPADEKRVLRALEVLEQTGRPLSSFQTQWGDGPEPRERGARLIGLAPERGVLGERIARRTRAMLDTGWREEALAIRSGPGFGRTSAAALGYREVLAWADGEAEREETEELIALRTRQFARRQGTWFRKFAIDWLEPGAPAQRALASLGW